MTTEECLNKLTKTGLLKGFEKLKSKIIYLLKLMILESCEVTHILKLHKITIEELFQVISSFLLFHFSAISHIQRKVCLDSLQCSQHLLASFFYVGKRHSCSRLAENFTAMSFSFPAIFHIHKSVWIPRFFSMPFNTCSLSC